MRYFFIYEDDRYIVLFIDRKVSRHYIYRYLCKLAEGDSYYGLDIKSYAFRCSLDEGL